MASTATPGSQYVEADIAIVAELYEAVARQDEKALLGIANPNIRWEAMEGFPHGGTKVGRNGLALCTFPHLHNSRSTGRRFLPYSVSEYSTLGGTWW